MSTDVLSEFVHLHDRWRGWYPSITVGAVAVLLVCTLVVQTYHVLTLPRARLLNEDNTMVSTVKQNIITEQTKMSIAHWHLFGAPERFAQLTTKFTLRGIILGIDNKSHQAIIASSDTEEGIYKVGDQLMKGTIIFEIFPDRVRIYHNGTIETLSMTWHEEEIPKGVAK